MAYFNSNKQRPQKRFDPINEHVRYPEVLVIGPNGESCGKMSSRAANELAASYNLDLYCVAPNANPPVCKIVNYGKFRYEQQKAQKVAKKNQKVVELKQIQLHISIGQHDLAWKATNAKEFMADGNKVEVCVVLKGREMAHQDLAVEMMKRFIELVNDGSINVEKQPFWEGKWYKCILAPKSKKA